MFAKLKALFKKWVGLTKLEWLYDDACQQSQIRYKTQDYLSDYIIYLRLKYEPTLAKKDLVRSSEDVKKFDALIAQMPELEKIYDSQIKKTV